MKIFVAVLLIVYSVSQSNAELKKETLVLLDNLATRETHSIFFKSLQGKISAWATSSFMFKIFFFIY